MVATPRKAARLILGALAAFALCASANAQPTSEIVTTKGICSPAIAGNNNRLTLHCNINPAEGPKIVKLLNKMLARQGDIDLIIGKLDEIIANLPQQKPDHFYIGNDDIGYGVGPTLAQDGRAVIFRQAHMRLSGAYQGSVIRYGQFKLDCGPGVADAIVRAQDHPIELASAQLTCLILP